MNDIGEKPFEIKVAKVSDLRICLQIETDTRFCLVLRRLFLRGFFVEKCAVTAVRKCRLRS